MNDASQRAAEQALSAFGALQGLIIDVRGNGGGSRQMLLALAGRILPAERPAARVVCNAAVYRRSDSFAEDHLTSRFLYAESAAQLDTADRAAIERFRKTFQPEPAPHQDAFSGWHYLVLRGDPRVQRLTCPVVVLMDAGCFSATDVFLAGMKELPGVTLLGNASSGGSGRSVSWTLPASQLTVRLSSMMSYQPHGGLFEGRGVAPDVEVPRQASDVLGETDAQLDAALRRLRQG